MLQSTLQPFVPCLTGSTVAIMQEREALISELQAALTPEVAQQVGEILDQSIRFSHQVRFRMPCVLSRAACPKQSLLPTPASTTRCRLPWLHRAVA